MSDRIFKAVYCLGLLVEMAIRVPYDRRRGREHVIVDRVTGQSGYSSAYCSWACFSSLCSLLKPTMVHYNSVTASSAIECVLAAEIDLLTTSAGVVLEHHPDVERAEAAALLHAELADQGGPPTPVRLPSVRR